MREEVFSGLRNIGDYTMDGGHEIGCPEDTLFEESGIVEVWNR